MLITLKGNFVIDGSVRLMLVGSCFGLVWAIYLFVWKMTEIDCEKGWRILTDFVPHHEIDKCFAGR